MSGLTLGARRTSRIPAAKLGQPAQSEPAAPVIDFEPAKLFVSAYDHLANRNPAFKLLVEKLNLVEVSSTGVPGVTPLPELPEPIAVGPVSPKLKELATHTFKPNQAYPKDDAIARLAKLTNVSAERAQNGLAMMVSQNLIALTLSNEYYLSESIPF